MSKKLISFFGALALLAGLSAAVSAQQLYMKNVWVNYPTGETDDHFCELGFTGTGNDVSFVPEVNLNSVDPNIWSAKIETERPRLDAGQNVYPGGCLKLCAQVVCVSTAGAFGVDELTFEIFKFGSGSNPLDPASTPPIRTIALYNVGTCPGIDYPNEEYITGGDQGRYCTAFDGSYNLNGIFGKTNGQFGFRAKVKTNQVSATAGNIVIEQTSAYPGENKLPIQVDVVNVHTVRSSPTVVGKITGIATQPYNIQYRLSKGANTTIKIFAADAPLTGTPARTIVDNRPRTGEGIPDGAITNGDSWDGRDNSGNFLPAGEYVAYINADSYDYFGQDIAYGATTYMELDPLQITDVAIKPLGASSTDQALISYLLTEAATVYVDIYPPGTAFNTVNASPPMIGGVNRCDGEADDTCIRRYVEEKDRRNTKMTYWDGRDKNGNPVCDGNYVYALYAVLPSGAASVPSGQIWTTKTHVGVIPVERGRIMAFVTPSSTVIGSSPTATNLDPFYFRYTAARDALVTLNILDSNSVLKRQVIYQEPRTGNFANREIWDGKDDQGLYVSSGSYQVELITTDPFQCALARTSTVTARISVDMFRIVNVAATPLLGGTTDMARISFELSQPMYMKLTIYPVSSVVNPENWPTVGGTPVYVTEGMRPGRFRITEYWDGRYGDSGMLVEDGRYPFTLVAHSTGTAQTIYATDKVYGYVDVSRGKIIFTGFEVIPSIPTMYNSSDTVTLPPYEIDYSVTRQANVKVQILDNASGAVLVDVTDPAGELRDGDILYRDFWDGKYTNGDFMAPGPYDVRVTAQDLNSSLISITTAMMTIDVDPLRIYDVSIVPLTLDNMAVVSYQVSEPMKVVTKVFKPGSVLLDDTIDPPGGKLVKRIIGVRPARTQISEYWDGTDLTLSKVPDGNYVFKIYGSTDTESISTISGAVTGTALASDIVTANIPVTRGGTSDLCGDFVRETFFAPNPYEGTSGWFKIPIIMNGWVSLKMYNLAGDLVYKRNYGDLANPRGGGNNVDGSGRCVASQTHEACWPKVNSYGKTVAPGVYFAVIRYQATDGTRDVCQTIKKILIP